jgi:hypothetical protein
VIISNHSSPDLLSMAGLQNYYRSILFDDECMGWAGESIAGMSVLKASHQPDWQLMLRGDYSRHRNHAHDHKWSKQGSRKDGAAEGGPPVLSKV